jgi:4-hydroxy-tetrahydrodipicolinate reductase
MGHEVEAAAAPRGHEVALRLHGADNADGSGITVDTFAAIDVAVDFSRADVVVDNVDAATRVGVPLVVGTTGWDEHIDRVRELVVEREGALVYGANFSVGANLFLRLAARAAHLFAPFADYDAYVFEHHHRHKADAPSGTALRLAQLVLQTGGDKSALQIGNPDGPIAPDALHVASLRAGSAFGEHRVGFDGSNDAVQLVHTARNRRGFAHGALLAAEWVVGRRGLFAFDAVLDEILAGGGSDGPS